MTWLRRVGATKIAQGRLNCGEDDQRQTIEEAELRADLKQMVKHAMSLVQVTGKEPNRGRKEMTMEAFEHLVALHEKV